MEKIYWEHFYEQQIVELDGLIPSQFAAFVLSEFKPFKRFVDLACGNGRDSFFFARYGKSVLALDQSERAISANVRLAKEVDLDRWLLFLTFELGPRQTNFQTILDFKSNEPTVFYSRFFLHAIDEDGEGHFWSFAKKCVTRKDFICLEFRTEEDATRPKETGTHFRRFLSRQVFEENVQQHGFNICYQAFGAGFAKYRDDDAMVARYILELR